MTKVPWADLLAEYNTKREFRAQLVKELEAENAAFGDDLSEVITRGIRIAFRFMAKRNARQQEMDLIDFFDKAAQPPAVQVHQGSLQEIEK